MELMLATVQRTTPALVFTVEGKAEPISVRPVPRYGPGREVIGSALAYGSSKESEKRIKSWMNTVRNAAQLAYGAQMPIAGPVAVEMTFFRKRPDNQVGTGRNAGVVKEWAPRYPIVYPDVLKLARGIEDAMTGVVYLDDAQIVEERTLKLFTSPGTEPRVEVTVWVLDNELVREQIELGEAA
jgi:Holliday junction resolvase RusA-like endonuclease